MDINDAWAYGRLHLTDTSPSPELDARLLLEHVLDVSHAFLVAHGDDELTAVQQSTYKTLIHRAQNHEPIPYIIGNAAFFDFDVEVSPAVLIPRPETEQLVELVLAWIKKQPNPVKLIDVGTGSGCIPIALARKCVNCEITAVDISPDALAVAKGNARRLAPEKIRFLQSDLLSQFSEQVDAIVANLPYVTAEEWTRLDDGVKLHEPALALIGGRDGLALIRTLLKQAQSHLNRHGAIFLEIGWLQGTAVQQLGQETFPNTIVTIHQDFAGHDRFVTIVRRSNQ